MSRKGRLPIEVPQGVTLKVDGLKVYVQGPKGKLENAFVKGISVEEIEGSFYVKYEERFEKGPAFQGLYRTLICNMIEGVTKGFEKRLEMIGVGYRPTLKGSNLDLQAGFSHPVSIPIPPDLNVAVDKTVIIISGIDKQRVGQFAAYVRGIRPPEPYQGKGIRYQGEHIRRKAGKGAGK